MPFYRRLLQGGSHRQARVRAGTLLLFATGAGLIVLLWLFQPLGSIQSRLSDNLFQSGHHPDGIILAEIDDHSLDVYGRFGDWPRTLHAQAVQNLSAAGARVIVFDLLFTESSPDDVKLAEAFSAAHNVVLPLAGVQPVGSKAQERYTFPTILQPVEPLKSAAIQLGHVNFPPDSDGVLRRMPLAIYDTEGKQYPSVLVSALFAQTQRPVPQQLSRSNGHVAVLNQDVPVDSGGAMRPNFKSRLSDFDQISYADLISGQFDPTRVRGKIVIIGLTATGSGDTHLTPFGGQEEAGIAVMGNALQSLQDGVFIREAGRTTVALGLIPLVAVMMYAVPRLSIRITAVLFVLVAGGYLLFSIALFNSDQKLIMNFVDPVIVLPAMFTIGLAYRVTAERADHRDLSDLFGRLASPEIVQELVEEADRGELELGGTMREVTVLFADLRGFTGISERLPPNDVVTFLNRAFDVMISSIVRHDGIVNKFGGDMVMAIWNAPKSTDDHAIKACRAAEEALAEMEKQGMWLEQEPGARFGFGINTGEVVAGNVGSQGRLEYTVMGDAVNVASRLCGAAGGGEVWIGERTYALARDRLQVFDLGPQVLKGRSRPVEAYRVVKVDVAVSEAAGAVT